MPHNMSLNVLYRGPKDRGQCWQDLINRQLPEVQWHYWPAVENHENVDILVCWKPPRDYQQDYPNLKVIFSVGAGVDQLNMTTVPSKVKVVRMLDPSIQQEMAEYVQMSVLNIHRNTLAYQAMNQKSQWCQLPHVKTADRTVGIMGLGNLGQATAKAVQSLGFRVTGWSNTAKKLEKVNCFYGQTQLTEFLQLTDILVCLLPLTAETKGLLDHTSMSLLPKGASIINVGRGQHLVVDDLIELLDTQHLEYAILDVFIKEPLADNDPLWQHPKVLVTPHIAAITQNDSAGQALVDNIQRYMQNKPMLGLVDRELGY